jgi:hypothetical protein
VEKGENPAYFTDREGFNKADTREPVRFRVSRFNLYFAEVI